MPISKKPLPIKIEIPADLAKRDLLLGFLSRLCRQNSLIMILLVGAFCLVFVFMPGVYLSKLSQLAGAQIIGILDHREIFFVIIVFIIEVTVFVYYEWQIRGLAHTLSLLDKNKVLGKPRGSVKSRTDFWIHSASYMNHPIAILLPLITSVVGILIWINGLTAADPFWFGSQGKWWQTNIYYFWLIWIPNIGINLYMGISIVVRQVIATQLLGRLFKEFTLEPKLFHPDKCNGLAPIGNFILKTSFIAVLFGFWVSLSIIFPLFYNQPLNIKADSISLLVLYIVAAPSVVFFSAWNVHREMVSSKEATLSVFAAQIQSIMQQIEINEVLSEKDLFDELYRRYQIAQEELKTWPFQIPALRSYGLTAVMPLISTVAPIIINNYIKPQNP